MVRAWRWVSMWSREAPKMLFTPTGAHRTGLALLPQTVSPVSLAQEPAIRKRPFAGPD